MSLRPSLLFYCQHSLGMGHLVRSLALADGLSACFHVVFLNGGPLPQGMKPPADLEVVALPPLGFDADGRLVSRDRLYTLDEARQLRREIILERFRTVRPQVVLIELFPFGRKKFRDELLPLLDEAGNLGPVAPLILCSLRDILVGRADQPGYDDRAAKLANRYFDAVLVHSDPRFARFEESFHPSAPLRVPIHYTGFVSAGAPPDGGSTPERARRIIVSAGGGLVGAPLLRAAIEAHALLWPAEGIEMKVIAGPFLPDQDWQSLCRMAQGRDGLHLRRYVADLGAEMRASAVSVSQCGYNTAMDILRAGVPALVVPFADGPEDEQMTRARRLERLGAIRVLDPRELNARNLAAELRALLGFRPQTVALDMNGTRNTAELVKALVQERRGRILQQGSGIRGQGSGATWSPEALRERQLGSTSLLPAITRKSGWLDPLRRALDSASGPVTFFLRDDDAGWCDDRLFDLLGLAAYHGVPIDVAVIPEALSSGLARRLRDRIEATPGHIEVHQHGFAHTNHEPTGRKCEFGPARSSEDQRRDIEQGRRRLTELLGADVRPIFTPPWNRCTATTGACLVELGFWLLSRDRSAGQLAIPGLAELPVGVDWFAKHKGVRLGRDQLGELLAAALRDSGPIGIMFHHALMDADELHAAGELLGLLASHGAAQCRTMSALQQGSGIRGQGSGTTWPSKAVRESKPGSNSLPPSIGSQAELGPAVEGTRR